MDRKNVQLIYHDDSRKAPFYWLEVVLDLLPVPRLSSASASSSSFREKEPSHLLHTNQHTCVTTTPTPKFFWVYIFIIIAHLFMYFYHILKLFIRKLLFITKSRMRWIFTKQKHFIGKSLKLEYCEFYSVLDLLAQNSPHSRMRWEEKRRIELMVVEG